MISIHDWRLSATRADSLRWILFIILMCGEGLFCVCVCVCFFLIWWFGVVGCGYYVCIVDRLVLLYLFFFLFALFLI